MQTTRNITSAPHICTLITPNLSLKLYIRCEQYVEYSIIRDRSRSHVPNRRVTEYNIVLLYGGIMVHASTCKKSFVSTPFVTFGQFVRSSVGRTGKERAKVLLTWLLVAGDCWLLRCFFVCLMADVGRHDIGCGFFTIPAVHFGDIQAIGLQLNRIPVAGAVPACIPSKTCILGKTH